MYEKEQLRALIDTAVDGIVSISTDGRVRLFNRASQGIFGHAPEAVVGNRVEMLMPSHYSVHHQGYIDHYLDTGEARIIGIGRQVEGMRADGSVFPMHLSVGEFQDKGERFFVSIIRDLSAEVAERERAQALQDQLEMIGRHSAVSEMGAALAHELNQPLTAIDLFLVAAEKQLETNPVKAREIFSRVRQEAERAGNIVRRIRQMVERSDGEQVVFDMRDVVESAVELCRFVDRQSGSIHMEPMPRAMLLGDPTQIRMILVNLIKNALDATDGLAEQKVTIRARKNGHIRVEVLDNGPGVHDSIEKMLFEPFSSTKKRGLGIGLSICRTIAESHGGTLTYLPPQEQEGGLGGALFALQLPLAEEAIDA